jgi:hypothetical protein
MIYIKGVGLILVENLLETKSVRRVYIKFLMNWTWTDKTGSD